MFFSSSHLLGSLIAFFAATIILDASHAAFPCESYDLNSDIRSPLRYIPVRDQDGSGTCYAEAAATLANHQLMKSGQFSSPVVHPVYAGSLYAATANRDTTSGGQSYTVLEQLRKFGFCGYSSVELLLGGLKKSGKFETTSELYGFLEALYDVEKSDRLQEFQTVYPTCNLKAAKEWIMARELLQKTQLGFSKALFGKCERFRPDLPLQSWVDDTDVSMAQLVRSSLKKANPIAVSINCFTDFASKPDSPKSYQLIKKEKTIKPIRKPKACADGKSSGHEVVIAAQRIEAGNCQFLIRNSWGAKWRAEGASACACTTKTGQYKQSCSKTEAKTFLGCWYKRADVLNHTWLMNAY